MDIRVVVYGLSAMAAIGNIVAQTPQSAPVHTYEVVSIHESLPGQSNSGFGPGAQGGLRARNVTAMQLLTFAWDARDYQFLGVPGWVRSLRFEVNLTPDRPESVSDQDMTRTQLEGWLGRNRQRVRDVLRDRFGLALRAETRELPIYALTIAKKGPRLTPTQDPKQVPRFDINGERQIIAKCSTTKALADALSGLLGRFVRDETGLDGGYDFKLEFALDAPREPSAGSASGLDGANAREMARPSIFTALTEQLGLRLVAAKGQTPVFVIERIERPAEN